MSSTNKTPNLQLSQFSNSDTPKWLEDYNSDMQKIDMKLGGGMDQHIVDLVYPVGSIYMSVSNTNPSTLFGGIWEQIKDVFLLATGEIYQPDTTGGEATHTLTTDEMPSHRHQVIFSSSATSVLPNGTGRPPMSNNNDANLTASALQSSGGGQAHNNMPPYITCYVWKRIG